MLPAFFRQHSRLVLGFLILTFPVLLVTSESLTSNNDIETWLPEKAPVRQVYDGFKDRFGAEELVLVGLVVMGGLIGLSRRFGWTGSPLAE